MIILDTSGIVAALTANERFHQECAHILGDVIGLRLLSPFVLEETDYFIERLGGVDREAAFLDEVARGVYELAPFDQSDVAAARHLILKYRSLKIGLADASIAVLAAKYGCFDVLTLDERHFRAIRPAPRKNFRILPADA
jgi:uncharacterized protein